MLLTTDDRGGGASPQNRPVPAGGDGGGDGGRAERPVPSRPAGPARPGNPAGTAPAVRSVRLLPAALCGLLLALAGVLAAASPAAAHAALTGSSPAEGSVVSTAPARVVLSFSEGVAMSDDSIRVLDPRGERVDKGDVHDVSPASGSTADTTRRGVSLRPGLPDGTYTIAWQAVSADSHPVSGALTFSVGAPSKTTAHVPEQQADAGGGAVGLLYGLGRYAAYAGYVLLVGGAALVLACWPGGARVRAVRATVVTGWVTLAASTLLMLLLRGSYTGSGELSAVFDLDGLRSAVGSKPGVALVSRLLLLGAAALVVAVLFGGHARGRGDGAARRRGPALLLGACATAVAAGLGATWALAEHASTGIQTWLAVPVDLVHLLAVACWLGGLTALLAALFRGPALPREAARHFSRLAFTSVVALALTGVYQSWRQLGSWSALTGTAYGRLLLVKVALVALMLATAWFSRRWTARLTDPAEAGPGADREPAENPDGKPDGKPDADAGPDGDGARKPDAEAGPDGARKPAEGRDGAATGAAGEARRAPVPAARPEPRPAPEAGTAAGDGQPDAPDALPDDDARERAAARNPERRSAAAVPPDAPAPAPAPAPGEEPARAAVGTRAPADTERAAQLARQRSAVRAARRKRDRDADRERTGLRRSLLVESGIAVVLLAVTTVLTNTEPGRTEEAARATGGRPAATAPARQGPVKLDIPFDTGGPGGKGTAHLRLAPGRTGDNTLHLNLTGPGGKPLDVPEATVALTLPAKDLGPLPVTPEPVRGEPGHWRADGVQLPMPGTWKAAVTVRTSDIDQVTEERSLTMG